MNYNMKHLKFQSTPTQIIKPINQVRLILRQESQKTYQRIGIVWEIIKMGAHPHKL
jgi:ABC-type hemin transport system ATPase subunit